jgi:hypothetical protein
MQNYPLAKEKTQKKNLIQRTTPMNSQQFVDQLSAIALRNVFNPYRDRCEEHDHINSFEIRRVNLKKYLDAAYDCGIESVWLGRDCGYRGGRRTGIALTDELHLSYLNSQFGIDGAEKATVGDSIKERTATEVWKIIREIDQKIFLWNVFPFHPFEEGQPMSNRRHTSKEFEECKELLTWLLGWLRPKRIVALGNDAQREVEKLGFKVHGVRHPSYGGHLEFACAIRTLYRPG